MCGEYWVGWFDHWGETHNGMTVKDVTAGLEWMISRSASVNLYMFHGGTSFGFMAGANYGKAYQPDVSSYDYDAPLDEAGRPTNKYFAIRNVVRQYAKDPANTPALPDPEPFVTVPRFALEESAALWPLLGEPKHATTPQTMESLGQSYGLILYRTRVTSSQEGTLEIADARDYALVFSGGRCLGTLDRRLKQTSLPVRLSSGSTLDILIDAMGRVNFGPHLVDDRKGILGDVSLKGSQLKDWDIFSLPLTDLSRLQFSEAPATGPAFYRAYFNLDHEGYTFFDTRGWGKGYMWVNGRNLGRYWSVGPQRTLYAPAEWLHSGRNEIVVLDLYQGGEHSIEGGKDPIYDMSAPGARQ
jgi:beta-galactosidase